MTAQQYRGSAMCARSYSSSTWHVDVHDCSSAGYPQCHCVAGLSIALITLHCIHVPLQQADCTLGLSVAEAAYGHSRAVTQRTRLHHVQHAFSEALQTGLRSRRSTLGDAKSTISCHELASHTNLPLLREHSVHVLDRSGVTAGTRHGRDR